MPDVLMPRLSDTMAEGVLSKWLKAEGDQVHRGDVIAEVETDKATMEVEAYDEGVLTQHVVAEGTTVPIGAPIAVIGDGGGEAAQAAAPAAAEAAPTPQPTTEAEPTGAADVMPATQARVPPPSEPAAPETRVRTSPLARAIARDHGIDLATITGTGPGGRIVRADVEAAVEAAKQAPAPPTPSAPTPAPRTEAPSVTAGADDETVPLTAVRRITAERLTQSAAAPHFYLTSVVDAGRLLAFRKEVNERLADSGTKVTVTDLLVRACAVALRMHPQVNSSWGGDSIIRHRRINVGIAVALEEGLIVPVVRDADRKSLGEIATEARALAERARAGKLTPDEFTGGTFTISNLGMFGVDHFTAIINPPEAAILAVGAASEEPVLSNGNVETRTTIKFTLSIDHRTLDGATAAAFLRDLVAICEEPLRIVV
jgi:pyruvate dehydrogenase E2 component (dihydrolipoamide acetyltransferase)